MLTARTQVDFTFVKVDSWDSGEKVSFLIDYTSYWSEALNSYTSGTHVCGTTDTAKNTWWQEVYFEKTYTLTHFSPYAWLTWAASLSSAGTDESWGLLAVKISTYMSSTYTPFWESNFQFKQLGSWTVTDKDTAVSGYFTTCGSINVFGGYGVFNKNTVASRALTGLPTHTKGKFRLARCLMCVCGGTATME